MINDKKSKILIGCLALLLVMAVGYALFSENITINGTATAKGNFDITATCQPGIESKFGTSESLGLDPEGGFDVNTCVVEDNLVKTNTSFLYPGSRRYYTVKLTNEGSIDALFATRDMTNTNNVCLADNKEGLNKKCSSSTQVSLADNEVWFNYSFTLLGVEDENGNILSSNEFYNSTEGTYLLKQNYSVYFIVKNGFSHSCLHGKCNGEFFAEYTGEFTLPFKQVTAD